MRLTRTTVVTGLLLIAAVLFAALLRGSQAEPVGGDATPRTRVRVLALDRREVERELRADGFLRARAEVTISAERAARLMELPVAEGEPVRAGELLARLDDTTAEANLDRARAVERETALQPRLSAAERAQALEQLRLAEHELRLRRPVSPIDGVVELHHVDVGEYVVPGTPLLDVIDASVLVLDVEVDAEVVGAFAEADPVRVDIPSIPGDGQREGSITRIASRAEAATRRFRVEVSMPGDKLRAGMHAVARFRLPAEAPALYVPKEAVREIHGQSGLFVVAEGRAQWRPVRVREVPTRPDLWRVEEGDLSEGGRVVVAGFPGLRAGMAVEVEQ